MKRIKSVEKGKEKEAAHFKPFNVVIAVVFVDQLSKLLAIYFYGDVVKNRGGAFGIFAQQNLLFTLISVVIVTGLILFALKKSHGLTNMAMRYALLLVIGGGISNILDRILRGYVIDFIKLPLWPSFNLADGAICVGVATILWYSFFEKTEVVSS